MLKTLAFTLISVALCAPVQALQSSNLPSRHPAGSNSTAPGALSGSPWEHAVIGTRQERDPGAAQWLRRGAAQPSCLSVPSCELGQFDSGTVDRTRMALES